MKKMLFIITLFLTVSAVITVMISATVNSQSGNVMITENVKFGDKREAEGLKVALNATYDRHLFWNTDYKIGEGGLTENEYDFKTFEATEEYVRYHSGFMFYTDFLDVNYTLSKDYDELNGFEKEIRDAFDAAEAGGEGSAVINLNEHFEYYPLRMHFDLPNVSWYVDDTVNYNYLYSDADRNKSQARKTVDHFSEFFKFPLSSQLYYEFAFTKYKNGKLHSATYGVQGIQADLNTVNAYTDNRCFFSVNNRDAEGNIIDFSNVPGGYGIYAFSFGKSAGDNTGIKYATLSNVFEIDESVEVNNITFNKDKTKLILFTTEMNLTYFTVIDIDTMQEENKILIGDYIENVNENEHFFTLFFKDSLGVISENENGEFVYEFKAKLKAEKAKELISQVYFGICDMDFANGKLVIASNLYDEVYSNISIIGFFVMVFDESGLLYHGEYRSSLTVNPDYSDREYRIDFFEKEPLTVKWS